MLGIFVLFLVVSLGLFVDDLIKKQDSTVSDTKIEQFQYSCNCVLNLIIAVSLLVIIRYFFEMARQQPHLKSLVYLKCALATLCGTFFLRSLLMLILIVEI
jgi:uncharacterized protein HemY